MSAKAATTGPEPGSVNILLVDDEPRNLDVLESILATPGRQLVRARSAEETLLALVQRDLPRLFWTCGCRTWTGSNWLA